jgi:hypothetical protein
MPQLSFYIDAETLAKIETAAKINNTSVSEWVTERLKESLTMNWPENYGNLFGSITDETFNSEKIKE